MFDRREVLCSYGGGCTVRKGISDGRDALMRAEGIQREAAALGFDWAHISGVMDKVCEEIAEIRAALDHRQTDHAKEELGDLLFSAVNLARFLDANPVVELDKATDRFKKRFARLRATVRDAGRAVNACTMDELDAIWERIKDT